MEPRRRFRVILPIALLAVASYAAFYYYQKAASLRNGAMAGGQASAAVQAQVADAVTRIGRLIMLPEGEIPTVATVTDPAKLKSQPFFANAKQGDIVLLYPISRKAYLYDPAANKIMEVATLNIGAGPGLTPQAKPTKPKAKTSTSRTGARKV